MNIPKGHCETDVERKLRRWKSLHEMFRHKLRRRWMRAVIRWILTLGLYLFLWEYQWVRLSLYVVLPLVLLNLGLLVGLTWVLPAHIARLEARIRA